MRQRLVFTYLALVCNVLSSPIDSQTPTTSSQSIDTAATTSSVPTPTPNSTVKATLIRNPKNFEVLDGVLIGIGVLFLLAISFVAWKYSWFGGCRKKPPQSEFEQPSQAQAQTQTQAQPPMMMPCKSKSMATTPYSLPISVIHAMNGVAESQKIQKGNVFNYTK